MGVKISCEYLGDLRVKATHGPSGTVLHTDAPVDNHGKGESFSPTDLTATSLATCVMTILGIQAQGLGLDFRGLRVEVDDDALHPRRGGRVGLLPVAIVIGTFPRLGGEGGGR